MSDEWFKSSASAAGNCVEVRFPSHGCVQVRNSADHRMGILEFTDGEWDAFLAGARNGEFDRRPASANP